MALSTQLFWFAIACLVIGLVLLLLGLPKQRGLDKPLGPWALFMKTLEFAFKELRDLIRILKSGELTREVGLRVMGLFLWILTVLFVAAALIALFIERGQTPGDDPAPSPSVTATATPTAT